MRIVYLDCYALNPGDLDFTELKNLGELEIYPRTLSTEDAVERIGDAEIVIVNKVPMGEEIFKACKNLKFLAVTATGYNNIDVDAATKHGITVTNVPSYSTPSVAQHIFALLLEVCLRTGDHHQAVCNGSWNACPDYTFHISPLIELHSKTIGFIGMGEIGCAAARIAQAFGMKTVCYHSSRKMEGVEHLDLDTLLKTSDVVSLCCPLTADNQRLIRKENIDKMKDGAILINTARGGLVDEKDLAEALKSGKLYGAGLDVLDCEPPKDSPLINLENAIITPHIAWAPIESRNRLLSVVIDNVRGYLGGEIKNKVN